MSDHMGENAPDMTVTPGAAPAVTDTATVETATTPATSSRRGRIRLDRACHIRRALAHVIRDLSAYNPPNLKPMEKIARARCLGFLLSEAAAAMRNDQIEQRIAALEALLRRGGEPN